MHVAVAGPDLQIRRGVGAVSNKFFSRPSGLHLVKNKGGPPLDLPLLLLVNMCELRCNSSHLTVKYVPCFFLLLVNLVKNKDEPAINQKHYY